MMDNITAESVGALVSYDPEIGCFTRLVKSGNCRAGSVVGSMKSNGYVYVSVFGKHQLAHRTAWLLMTGSMPGADIDHRDGDKTNNCWSNLREATRAENMQNQRRAYASNKSSGLLGVSWSAAAGKWAAAIKISGVKKHLGLFADAAAAHDAYLAAKREMHPFGMI